MPLNEWFGKHPLEPMEWQWFFSMATIGTNGMAMGFNGLQPFGLMIHHCGLNGKHILEYLLLTVKGKQTGLLFGSFSYEILLCNQSHVYQNLISSDALSSEISLSLQNFALR